MALVVGHGAESLALVVGHGAESLALVVGHGAEAGVWQYVGTAVVGILPTRGSSCNPAACRLPAAVEPWRLIAVLLPSPAGEPWLLADFPDCFYGQEVGAVRGPVGPEGGRRQARR